MENEDTIPRKISSYIYLFNEYAKAGVTFSLVPFLIE